MSSQSKGDLQQSKADAVVYVVDDDQDVREGIKVLPRVQGRMSEPALLAHQRIGAHGIDVGALMQHADRVQQAV